jgi:hypothetical protein
MSRFGASCLALSSLIGVVSGSAVELTEANFESNVFGGKNAFVKFLAPW